MMILSSNPSIARYVVMCDASPENPGHLDGKAARMSGSLLVGHRGRRGAGTRWLAAVISVPALLASLVSGAAPAAVAATTKGRGAAPAVPQEPGRRADPPAPP